MTENLIRLERTCLACPEQYDAYLGFKRVGYLRLRHGQFTVHCPDTAEEMVYVAYPKGDGIFEDDEREHYLRFAVYAIYNWLWRKSSDPEYGCPVHFAADFDKRIPPDVCFSDNNDEWGKW
ncbi:MAG TPA: hypothetical protein VFY83_00650 [Anaerolineales bacterium]|nr:hypothetical protein [Anaerolineales bacterium]